MSGFRIRTRLRLHFYHIWNILGMKIR
jgi:hypothetical protein